MSERLVGTRDIEAIRRAWRQDLARLADATTVLLGIPCDTGAGFFRGAAYGPAGLRLAHHEQFGPLRAGTVDLGDVTWRSAYTWSRFAYVDDPAFGDNDLPGAPKHVLYTELRWEHPSGWWLAPNLDASLSPYFVDSANTTENDRFALVGLRAGVPIGPVELSLEASNLTDEVYSGSVQVDNALGRYLEPGNGRSLYVGLGWRRE